MLASPGSLCATSARFLSCLLLKSVDGGGRSIARISGVIMCDFRTLLVLLASEKRRRREERFTHALAVHGPRENFVRLL